MNSPPSIEGCPANATVQGETQQSINTIQLSLPALNLSITDPDGDSIMTTNNVTSSVPLSFITIENIDPNTTLISVPGLELGPGVNELVIFAITIATDPFGAESTCELTYRINITQAVICALIGNAPSAGQIFLFFSSVSITVQNNIAQVNSRKITIMAIT